MKIYQADWIDRSFRNAVANRKKSVKKNKGHRERLRSNMSCIHFARQRGFRGLFPVGKMCFVDNAIRDPVCGDHPFATATTTRRRTSEFGTMRSAACSYLYRPIPSENRNRPTNKTLL